MSEIFKTPYPNIKHKPTSTKEIENIIEPLKTKNSYGYDEISTKLLEISCLLISPPINYICNKTLSTGVFPDQLKFSVIIPLYKKVIKIVYLTIDLHHF
jgi:hypothetical protein